MFVDLETSGLVPGEHEILEIAAARCAFDTLEPIATLHAFVAPTRDVDPEAAAKNGYEPRLWAQRGAVSAEVALALLAPILRDAEALAGSKPSFDRDFLEVSYALARLPYPAQRTHRLVDVSQLAWPLVVAGLTQRTGLDATATYLQIPGEAHRAWDDMRRAREIYRQLLSVFVPALLASRDDGGLFVGTRAEAMGDVLGRTVWSRQ